MGIFWAEKFSPVVLHGRPLNTCRKYSSHWVYSEQVSLFLEQGLCCGKIPVKPKPCWKTFGTLVLWTKLRVQQELSQRLQFFCETTWRRLAQSCETKTKQVHVSGWAGDRYFSWNVCCLDHGLILQLGFDPGSQNSHTEKPSERLIATVQSVFLLL